MKILSNKKREVAYISAVVLAVTVGHYLIAPHHGVLHNILQRLYYIPIFWAAYRYGKRGGMTVSTLCGLLYVPHIFISWQMNPEYQVNQILEIVLFVIIGSAAGILFEQKVNNQRLLQSYEKMAMFGNLSRSIIRSLKTPIKVIKGMLITVEPMAQRDTALQSYVKVMQDEIEVIQSVRNDLISLVERKKLRLKKQNLNEVMFGFMAQVETYLRLRNIRFTKKTERVKLSAFINKKAINEALHHLVGIMINNSPPAEKLCVYTGESTSYVWLGATVQDIRLTGYYLSDLSCLDTDNYPDYNLISVLNTMNNHFGDVKFRWDNRNLIEFIFVFPKKLRLPWYLKDEALPSRKQPQLVVHD